MRSLFRRDDTAQFQKKQPRPWTHRKGSSEMLSLIDRKRLQRLTLLLRVCIALLIAHGAFQPLTAAAGAPSNVITFEDGSLVHPVTGVTRVSGNVVLDNTSAIKGVYAASIHTTDSAYLEEAFPGADDVLVSFYLKINSLPSVDVRIAQISNDGTTVAAMVLRQNGQLRLRHNSNTIGSETAPLLAGAIYRVGIRQKRGTGADAILEGYLATGDDPFVTPFAGTTLGAWTSPADRVRLGATNSNALDALFDDITLDFGAAPQAIPPSPTAAPTDTPVPATSTAPAPTATEVAPSTSTPTPTLVGPTATPTPTQSGPTPTLPAISRGIWTSAQELASKPTSGPAWDAVKNAANQDFSNPSAANQDNNTNVYTLAASIVYARTGDVSYRNRVVAALNTLVSRGKPTDGDGRTLGVARKVGAYALAADLIGYRTPQFEQWLRDMAENYVFSGETLWEMYYRRPNNWGAMAFGSLTAIYSYLGDDARLTQVRDYFVQGIIGPDPGYKWGGDEWQCSASDLRLINPPCTKQGLNIGGLIPDDQRRAGGFNPSGPANDVHIGGWIDGAIMGARILDRQGMGIWDVGGQAFKRMIIAHEVTYPQLKLASNQDWVLPILDKVYGLNLAGSRGTGYGKNAGFGAYIK